MGLGRRGGGEELKGGSRVVRTWLGGGRVGSTVRVTLYAKSQATWPYTVGESRHLSIAVFPCGSTNPMKGH